MLDGFDGESLIQGLSGRGCSELTSVGLEFRGEQIPRWLCRSFFIFVNERSYMLADSDALSEMIVIRDDLQVLYEMSWRFQ